MAGIDLTGRARKVDEVQQQEITKVSNFQQLRQVLKENRPSMSGPQTPVLEQLQTRIQELTGTTPADKQREAIENILQEVLQEDDLRSTSPRPVLRPEPPAKLVDVTNTDQGQLTNPEPLFELADDVANENIVTSDLDGSPRQPSLPSSSDSLPLVSTGDSTVVESRPTPKLPLPISEEKFVQVEQAPTVDQAVEIATEDAVKADPNLAANPVKWVFDNNLIGLDENNKEHQQTIVDFFTNSLGSGQKFATKSSVTKTEGAWCGAFVDHVLTNLGYGRINSKDRYDRVRARQYEDIGSAVELDDAKSGDIVVKKTGKQYHVGFFVGYQEGIATSNKENARALQQGLLDKGFDPKGVDGLWGNNSSTALEAYQKANNLEVTGQITPELFKKITGQDGTATKNILILGGNQDNQVNVTAYPAATVTAVRRVNDVGDLDKDTFNTITEDISYGGSTR